MGLSFTKMHGIGNDFVLLDFRAERSEIKLNSKVAKRICDRHFGIGADQLLVLVKTETESADVGLMIWNTDGSEAQMCGNGVRAVAEYLSQKAPNQVFFSIETKGGIKRVEKTTNGYRVNMGIPKILGETECTVSGRTLLLSLVDMGNPHAVCFESGFSKSDVKNFGPLIENHSDFPMRTNVEWVEVVNRTDLKVQVWERGAGMTLACGTGACAAFVAARLDDRVEQSATVKLPGGALFCTWEGKGHPVFMEGEAKTVYAGIIDPSVIMD